MGEEWEFVVGGDLVGCFGYCFGGVVVFVCGFVGLFGEFVVFCY